MKPKVRTAKRAVANRNAEQTMEEWDRVQCVLDSDLFRCTYLYGPPGVGKTYGAYRFGRVEKGFYAVTLTEETSAAELRGHFLFRGGDAVWHDGPFVRAMREGKRLVVNELMHASGDVQALLYPVLESEETAKLTLPTGETVEPSSGFHVVVTDNTPPDGLPLALQDRFMAILRVTRPHPSALSGLSPELRRAAEAGLSIKDDRRISARGWQTLNLLFPHFGLFEACILTFGPDRGKMLYQALRLGDKAEKSAE